MNSYIKAFVCLAATAALASCASNKANISGTVTGAEGKDIIVKKLASAGVEALDTIKTGADGSFSYKMEIAKGDPDFVYVYYGETPVASLLLQAGDAVSIKADTLGIWTVDGSEECSKLLEAVSLQRSFAGKIASGNIKVQDYIDYYRQNVKFIMANSKSLSVIPLLSEKLPGGEPIFSQLTDAIHFRATCDSLKTVYPESRYVRALDAEAERRMNQLQMSNAIEKAEEVGYIDIVLPNEKGQKVKLSEVKGKVVMVYFWASEMGEQKMFNQDVLKPVYRDFKGRGFEIYAISLDTDKAAWATAVRTQNTGWINVCDGLGTASPSVLSYNVNKIPSLFFIVNGELVTGTGVKDEATLRRFLSSKL